MSWAPSLRCTTGIVLARRERAIANSKPKTRNPNIGPKLKKAKRPDLPPSMRVQITSTLAGSKIASSNPEVRNQKPTEPRASVRVESQRARNLQHQPPLRLRGSACDVGISNIYLLAPPQPSTLRLLSPCSSLNPMLRTCPM